MDQVNHIHFQVWVPGAEREQPRQPIELPGFSLANPSVKEAEGI